MSSLSTLLQSVRACELCKSHLPMGPRPILQVAVSARILIAGQAPGRKVHESGVPFDDASGDRLRFWLGMSKDEFYDPQQVAILPMGFCYPGTGHSGDLPPRKECAPAWRGELLSLLKNIQLTLVIGQYATRFHLPKAQGGVTEIVLAWRDYWPAVVPLPHPSPRNNIWLKRNAWFDEYLVPRLQARVRSVLQ